MTALEQLGQFRADRPTRAPRAKPAWAPLTPDRLRVGAVLAWDQTIRNAGWCLLVHDQVSTMVLASGTCRTKPGADLKGWATTLPDVASLAEEMRVVLMRHQPNRPRSARGHVAPDRWFEVVHEAPPFGGNSQQMKRSESTVLASAALHVVCRQLGLPLAMVQNQGAKKLLVDVGTGPGQTPMKAIEKATIKEGLARLPWLGGQEHLTNEHQRDAAAVGLLRLTQEVE